LKGAARLFGGLLISFNRFEARRCWLGDYLIAPDTGTPDRECGSPAYVVRAACGKWVS
jgi:hypothetical protein